MQLNVSPSAVNRQILKLEAEYGVALFERLPRGVSLTEAGRILVADIDAGSTTMRERCRAWQNCAAPCAARLRSA